MAGGRGRLAGVVEDGHQQDQGGDAGVDAQQHRDVALCKGSFIVLSLCTRDSNGGPSEGS